MQQPERKGGRRLEQGKGWNRGRVGTGDGGSFAEQGTEVRLGCLSCAWNKGRARGTGRGTGDGDCPQGARGTGDGGSRGTRDGDCPHVEQGACGTGDGGSSG